MSDSKRWRVRFQDRGIKTREKYGYMLRVELIRLGTSRVYFCSAADAPEAVWRRQMGTHRFVGVNLFDDVEMELYIEVFSYVAQPLSSLSVLRGGRTVHNRQYQQVREEHQVNGI